MSLVENVESLAFINAPYLLNDICFIYPLSIGQILALGDKYNTYIQLLTLDRSFIIKIFQANKKEVELSEVPDPFDFLMADSQIDNKFLLELQNALSTFIQEEILVLPSLGKIVIGLPEEKRFIDKTTFFDFQNVIRIQNKIKEIEKIPENESPKMRHFREMRELRDAVKRKQEGNSNLSIANLMSILCVYGIGITPSNIKDISVFAFYNLLHFCSNREKFISEMEFLYGGADPKKLKPKYWWTNNENN